MKVVKMIKVKDGEYLTDLTIGKEYVVNDVDPDDNSVWVTDDIGDVNVIYNGEYEVVE